MPKKVSPNGKGALDQALTDPLTPTVLSDASDNYNGEKGNTILVDDVMEDPDGLTSIGIDSELEALIADISDETGISETDLGVAMQNAGMLTTVDGGPFFGFTLAGLPEPDLEIFNGQLAVGDVIFARGGDDRIGTGSGNDVVDGGTGNDTIRGGAGIDFLFGGDGDDLLSGGGDGDVLFGQDGNDTLKGGNGNDRLDGGAGDDAMRGGNGDDVFVFVDGFGTDSIADFRQGDVIDLAGVSGITGFADLAASHMIQDGNDVLIADGADSVRLANTSLEDLTADSFQF